MQKTKEDVTQASAAGNTTDHGANAQSALVPPSPNNTVPQSEQTVNNNISRNSGDNSSNVDGGENQSYNSDTDNNLTPEQKERYDAAILRYKSSDSYKINAKLREDEVLTEEEEELVNTLDEALEQLPTYEGTVYRQITFDDFGGEEAFNEFLLEHTPGKFIFYEQYTSCSTAEDGYTVEGDYKVQLIVDGKNACDVAGYGNNMEKEVIFPRNTMFIVQDIDTSGQYPIIYLQEDVENGYDTNEEQGETVRDLQASHSVHGDMQGVSEENTAGNRIGQVRPQSTASGGQRNTVRAERGNGALLSAESEEQEVSSDTDGDSAPTGGRVLDMPAITVEQQNFVKKIGKALGRNVEFVNMDKFLKQHDIDTKKLKIYPDGAIDGEGNIYIWYNTEKAVQFLFKHELMHFGERSKYYTSFVNVVRKSRTYLQWLQEKTGLKNASLEKMEAVLMDKHRAAQSGLKKMGYDEARAEIIADFVGDKCFGESLEDINKIVNSVNDVKERNVAVRFLHDFFLWLKNKLVSIGAIKNEVSVIEENFARMIDDANNTKTSDTQDGGLKYSLNIKHTDGTTEELADARNLTAEQAVNYLNQAKRGALQGHTYIPVRKDTPQVIIDTLTNAGEKIKNLSLIMQVRKAQQAMSTKNNGSKVKHGNNVRNHALNAEEIVEIIGNLDNPTTMILQTNRYNQFGEELPNNVAVFVEYKNNGNEGIAVIEFESSIDPEFIGREFGDTDYHTVVTLFEPDTERDGIPFDYAEELLSNPDNFELEIVRRQPSRSATREKHPNTSSELSSNNRVAQKPPVVKNNSMQESENYSSEKNDLKFSVPTATENETDTDTQSTDFTAEFKGLMQSFQNGEIGQDEYMRRVSELYQESIDENGEIPQGEMVEEQNKPFAVPKSVNDGTKVRQHVSRILESGRATPEQENVFKEMILDDKFSYTPTSNEANIRKAEKAIEKEGYQKAKENWSQNIANWAADANTVAKGEALLQLAFEQKNTVDIVNLAAQLAELGTYIGQGLQAMSLVKRMGGLGQLVYLERCVARINNSLEKKIHDGKANSVKIDPTLAQQLAESKTEAEFEITYAAIVKDVAVQGCRLFCINKMGSLDRDSLKFITVDFEHSVYFVYNFLNLLIT